MKNAMQAEMDNARRLYRQESAETVKPSDSEAKRMRLMVAMWERMAQWFGPLWESSYGTVTDQTIHAWRGALNSFTDEEIGVAIKQCADWDGKFPPTFPEFKALCLAARGKLRPTWTDARVEREKSFPELVAPQKGDSEVARREKARIAAILRGEDVESKAESWRKLHLDRIRGPLPETMK